MDNMSDSEQKKTSLSYRDAGVNIDSGNELIERIKPAISTTHIPGVLGGLGGFGGLFELPVNQYQQPVLVSGTDGVGTKLKLAVALGQHKEIGIDLVAMCVNDVIVTGAKPLFFLDYYATGALDLNIATDVIKGIANGCKLAGAALIGGETAEMPGVYSGADYDLAGFCVGIVEKHKIITGDAVSAGDTLIALASSGPHSNGYSLIRKIIEVTGARLNETIENQTLGEKLLKPTRIYAQSLMQLLEIAPPHAIAHITGGGLLENVPRVLPDDFRAVIDHNTWEKPAIFEWLQAQGGVSESEMLRTFNCGIGMVLVVAPENTEATLSTLADCGEKAWVIGAIEAKSRPDQASVEIKPRR